MLFNKWTFYTISKYEAGYLPHRSVRSAITHTQCEPYRLLLPCICSKEILACLEKEDSSLPNFESLITIINNFWQLHTNIVKILFNSNLNSILELFTDKICKNNKLNLFNLIEKVCKQHFEYISGKELKGN